MSSVVVLGGGYGGMKVAKAVDDVADVTLVDPSDAFLHNVASWRALVEPSWVERIFLPYDRLLHRGSVRRDRAVAVAGRTVTLASGAVLEPDHLVLATGSAYPFPAKVDDADADVTAARAALVTAHAELASAARVLLVGAGPAGLELAGEIRHFFPDKQVTVVDVAPDILTGPFDQELREELKRQLEKLGVELVLGSPLRALPSTPAATAAPVTVATTAGTQIRADIWFRCFGVAPANEYLPAAWLDGAGRVRVDDHLRVPGVDGVYALGDLADADRPTAGAAGRQAEVVAANLRAEVTGAGDRAVYEPGPPAILIPLGPEGGAGQLPTGLIGPEQASEIKGKAMLLDWYEALFDAPART
jgi:NADH dehydrogenase FAD-containing subunit